MDKIELIDRMKVAESVAGLAIPMDYDDDSDRIYLLGYNQAVRHAVRLIRIATAIDAEWELFQRITAAYYDKQMFFLQDDGSVYDREEAVYHSSTDAAIDAFIRRISEG